LIDGEKFGEGEIMKFKDYINEGKLKVGDIVQYSKKWLRSTGSHTGDLPRAKGKITKLDKLGAMDLAHIDWDKKDIPPKVIVANLEKVR